MKPAKILVIDDSDDFRELTILVLSQYFTAKFLQASSGEDGVGVIAANPDISIVICDYMMPNGTGAWVRREIDKVRPGLPFILYTSMPQHAVDEFEGLTVTALVDKCDYMQLKHAIELIRGLDQVTVRVSQPH